MDADKKLLQYNTFPALVNPLFAKESLKNRFPCQYKYPFPKPDFIFRYGKAVLKLISLHFLLFRESRCVQKAEEEHRSHQIRLLPD